MSDIRESNIFTESNIGTGRTLISYLSDVDSSRNPHIETIYKNLVAHAKSLGIHLDHQYTEESAEYIIQQSLFEISRLKPQIVDPKNSESRERVGSYLVTRILHTEERLQAFKRMKDLE